MMSCSLCYYKWCWICGFPEESLFHKLQFGGNLCQLFNSAAGFEAKLHWIPRTILAVLGFSLLPIILFIIFFIASFYELYIDHNIDPGHKMLCFKHIKLPDTLGRKIAYLIVLTTARVLIFILVITGILVIDTIILILITIPYYLLVTFLSLNLLYRFCLMRKRHDLSTDKI